MPRLHRCVDADLKAHMATWGPTLGLIVRLACQTTHVSNTQVFCHVPVGKSNGKSEIELIPSVYSSGFGT
jgi:hypothetical protein